ncbi:MAG: tRNA (adenosine(37)-N6)-threonylcarbamoyltransferase complex ATPase subunit type 1 TsaE [Candidatus Saccharimonadales bacterium]
MIEIASESDMKRFGETLGRLLIGGETIELVGDVGAGKTTLVKGLARSLGITDDIQSPSFTISRTYDARDQLQLMHYDFYRLDDPGIMAADLHEATSSASVITVVEWADVARSILPMERLTLYITPIDEATRQIDVQSHGAHTATLVRGLL